MKKTIVSLTVLLASALSLAGCGGGSGSAGANNTGQAQKPLEPVTLEMYQTQTYWTEVQFEQLLAEPLKKKYPHITVHFNEAAKQLKQSIVDKTPIDLIMVWNGLIPEYEDYGIFEDITPLLKKDNLDLSRFDPAAVQAAKDATLTGQLYGVPNMIQLMGLFYNKDIFDKFGVAYPKDGMTWEDTIDLAKKVTRNTDGVQYNGYDPSGLTRIATTLSLIPVDGRGNKVLVNSDGYKRVFELSKQIFAIPGNTPKAGAFKGSAPDRFMKDKTTAMQSTVNMLSKLQTLKDLNWDVAQYPSFKERPNLYSAFDMHVLTISSISQHKDDAVRVLEALYTDEAQLIAAHMGRMTPMKDPKFQQEFVKGVAEFEGKHIQSMFKSKPAPSAPPYSVFYNEAQKVVADEFANYNKGAKDVNTALRDAEERIKKLIADGSPQ
ncbi:MAG: transporter substrate-binding protein [Paenibacillaceae bacterium]|jgi:multiple sugar transport system substrate-binding protein|nr:transporter substrate-binding protein [Paenibacillaceae bacterium]